MLAMNLHAASALLEVVRDTGRGCVVVGLAVALAFKGCQSLTLVNEFAVCSWSLSV